MVKQIETVSIIGLGALGILFGHHLSKRMPPGTLRIIADNNRIENYTRNPVCCNGEKCEFHFVTPDEDTGPADLVIFTVKFGGLDKAIQDMRNQIGKDTIILSALNGISSEEVISRAYGWENILYCVAQGMDGIRTGNSLRYENMGMLCFGDRQPGTVSDKVKAVEQFFLHTDFPHEVETDMQKRMWGKFMLNVGVNQTVGVYRGTYGDVQVEGEAQDTMIAAMREVISISQKEGVPQTEEDLHYWINVIKALHPDGKPSMAQDIDAKRPTEVELFSGTVIRLGKKHRIPTPVNQFLYDRIKAMEKEFQNNTI
jgi:2-dehydropantoate 2-reductase